MHKIKQFNKTNIEHVRKEIQTKLNELKKLGLEIYLGNIRYDAEEFTSKITVRLEGAQDPMEKEFKLSKEYLQYKHALGKEVQVQGKSHNFVGFKPRARKNKAIIERNGKSWRIGFSAIKDQLTDDALKETYPEEFI